MSIRQKENVYVGTLVVLSILLTVFVSLNYSIVDYVSLVVWCILAFIAETFLIEGPNKVATSVSAAVYLAITMTENPLILVIVVIFGLSLRAPLINDKRMTILNTEPFITFFNATGAGVIPYTVSSLVYVFLYGDNNSVFISMICASIALVISELLSLSNLTLYKSISRKHLDKFIDGFVGIVPGALAIGALGMILAFAKQMYGIEIVALFFIPLLLARYSFKLYFDSQKMAMETIHALNEALHVRDAYTSGHAGRVEEYAVMLAKAMGYSSRDVETLKTAAVLHDIGKIGIPDSILNKNGRLTDDEYVNIKNHPMMGAQILKNVDSLKKISVTIKYHHERPDGKGYPEGLVDKQIPMDAAILAIADSYDAMTSKRSYREPLRIEEALSEIDKYKGMQFNEPLAELFIEIIKESEEYKAELLLEEVEGNDEIERPMSVVQSEVEEVYENEEDEEDEEDEAVGI